MKFCIANRFYYKFCPQIQFAFQRPYVRIAFNFILYCLWNHINFKQSPGGFKMSLILPFNDTESMCSVHSPGQCDQQITVRLSAKSDLVGNIRRLLTSMKSFVPRDPS